MKTRILALAFASMAAASFCGSVAWADTTPQVVVECTGWHALCSMASDCKVVSGDRADCDCWRVKENHFVVVPLIKNPTLMAETQAACNSGHYCDVDEAPICRVIQSGNYSVDGQTYEWVSTYSYRGWCENWDAVACDTGPWADCMTSPCTENTARKADPDRPLSCQCTIEVSEFIGTHGKCKSKKGQVMSTIPRDSWNFKRNEFMFPMPKYEYVKAACEALHSDSER